MSVRRAEPSLGQDPPRVLRQALTRFVVSSMVALAALALVTVLVGRSVAEEGARNEAQLRTTTFADNVAGPLVDSRVRAGEAAARRRLDTVLRSRLQDGSVQHITVWGADHTVIWADDARLVGRSFDVAPEISRLFGTSGARSVYTDLDEPEHPDWSGSGPLLEVNAATRDADGEPIVFEAYWALDRLNADRRAILRRLLPLSLLALLAFQLVVLPLALSLARRVDRAQHDRTALLERAVGASERERRRITQYLHDGVIQDLSGLAYALPAIAAQLPPGSRRVREVLVEASADVRRQVDGLRTLVSDLYPAAVGAGGLAAALEDLVRGGRANGLDVALVLDGDLAAVSPQAAAVTYRVVREGLRNVSSHARAASAQVLVRVADDAVVIQVSDDGRGPAGADVRDGHLGLRLLHDAVQEMQGSLELAAGSGGGSVLTARLPAAVRDDG